MKGKKRMLSLSLALMLACPFLPVKAESEDSLEPSDLHFRKFYTGRNFFDSEIP